MTDEKKYTLLISYPNFEPQNYFFYSRIDHNKITRKEAEQIAKLEGHFVEERLQLLLDKELDENEKIFEDD